jgi:hypothetical protein
MSAARPDLMIKEDWYGGYYEADMAVGLHSAEDADTRLRCAVIALWSNPALAPLAFSLNPTQPVEADGLARSGLDDLCRIYGFMKHATFGDVPFTSVAYRDESPGGEDWLAACVPMGGLSRLHAPVGGYPFGDVEKSELWRAPLEKALADLALSVAAKVPFRIARIGFELGPDDETKLLSLWIGHIVNDGGYRYIPTTKWN